MIEFKALDWWYTPMKLWCAAVHADKTYENFDDLIGTIVLVDNRTRTVRAVERYMHGGPVRQGEKIGLVVE